MPLPHNIAGQRFGRIVATERVRSDGKHSYWAYKCDCGETGQTTLNSLRRGLVVSCGCFRREHSRTSGVTHGGTGTRIYGVWAAMKRRCENPNVPEFKNYGGRGITLCDRWRDFANFLADMGPCPKGMSLDRIDNDGPYGPENCRWATRVQQARNMRGNRLIVMGGKRLSIAAACEAANLPVSTVATRMYRGWPESRWFVPKVRD